MPAQLLDRPRPTPIADATRRQVLTGLTATALLAACGPEEDRPADEGRSAAGFPRTIDHELGSTTIAAPPERILALTDGAELASLLALGVTPVGFGQRNDPLQPWIIEASGDAETIERFDVVFLELPLEVIAGLDPDVVFGQAGFLVDGELDVLADVAPTLATPEYDWRACLRMVAAAVGREDEAVRLQAEVEEQIGAFVADTSLPEGFSFEFVSASPREVGRFFASYPLIGLAGEVGASVQPDIESDDGSREFISPERLDVIQGADAIVVFEFGSSLAELEANPLWAGLPAVQAGRVVVLTEAESSAGSFDSVLTVPVNLQTLARVIAEVAP